MGKSTNIVFLLSIEEMERICDETLVAALLRAYNDKTSIHETIWEWSYQGVD